MSDISIVDGYKIVPSRRKKNDEASKSSSGASSGNSPGVWLGTVHQSKGLEWRVVFILS